jgi:hypothetical protein
MDNLVWSIELPQEKSSNYTAVDYVINDLGIFSKTEIRTKKTGMFPQLWGFRVGKYKIKGTDYLAQAVKRSALLWQKISRVTIDDLVITVWGNRETKILIFCTAENFAEVEAMIRTMRTAHPTETGPSIDAASWLCWEEDEDWAVGESLDDMITAERNGVDRFIEEDILEKTIIR